ncbi:MAG: DUF2169 domain-containing protein [Rubrivivax sp.]|nr:DUF2169 domain-containing protein [Rubrivivax sp.]
MSYSAAPEISNLSPFVAEPLALADEDGRSLLVIVVKATFSLGQDSAVSLAPKQRGVDLVGRFVGDPACSSCIDEPECAFFKPGTDVVLHARAFAPHAGACEMSVGLRVGSLLKVVQVVGDRHWWKPTLGVPRLTPPEPFERMPLVYERAFGGWDRHNPDPTRHAFEPRNPAGTGFLTRWHHEAQPLRAPNIEDPAHRLSDIAQQPPPAGFGFVAPHWRPRANLAGTYDERWTRTRKPLLPQDFDRRFFNAASTGLVAPGHLAGNEPVLALGVTPGGRLSFALPGVRPPEVDVRLRGRGPQRPSMCLDTVLIDVVAMELVLTWRGHLAVAELPRDVVAVVVRADWPPH